MDRNTKALRALAVTGAALTYAGAVVYGDVMFISVMHVAFPSGLLGALAIAGAVMTAASAITLPLALHYWFAPGLQFIWGILFWLLDVAALALNAMLAYAVSSGSGDPWLLQWQMVSPATPLLAVIGWGLVFLLDPAHKLRHAQAELEADLIDIHAAQLRQAAKGDDVAAAITTGARLAAAETAGKLTGARTWPTPNLPGLAATPQMPSGAGKQQTGSTAVELPGLAERGETAEAITASANGHGPKGARRR